MTIIFGKGEEFWIEVLEFDHGVIATANNDDVTIALERPGTFLGASQTMNISTSATTLVMGLIRVGADIPVKGDSVVQITSRIRNDSGSSQQIDVIMMIFMRKRG